MLQYNVIASLILHADSHLHVEFLFCVSWYFSWLDVRLIKWSYCHCEFTHNSDLARRAERERCAMGDTGAQGGTALGGVKVGEERGVGLGVALDVANQAEAGVVAQMPHAATSSHAAPMEVKESVAGGSRGSHPKACLTTTSRLMGMSCETSPSRSPLLCRHKAEIMAGIKESCDGLLVAGSAQS